MENCDEKRSGGRSRLARGVVTPHPRKARHVHALLGFLLYTSNARQCTPDEHCRAPRRSVNGAAPSSFATAHAMIRQGDDTAEAAQVAQVAADSANRDAVEHLGCAVERSTWNCGTIPTRASRRPQFAAVASHPLQPDPLWNIHFTF